MMRCIPEMRLSELLGLVWDDVDLNRGLIHVRAQLSMAHIDRRRGGWPRRPGRRSGRSR